MVALTMIHSPAIDKFARDIAATKPVAWSQGADSGITLNDRPLRGVCHAAASAEWPPIATPRGLHEPYRILPTTEKRSPRHAFPTDTRRAWQTHLRSHQSGGLE